jgi:creatinine amidohydrolase
MKSSLFSKSLAASAALLTLSSPAIHAQPNSLLIENMTSTEVRDAIAAGKTTAIYYAASIEQGKKTGHMRYAGSINLSEETFGAVAHDVALSAISAGFKNVFLMCDHGGAAQSQLAKVAEKMNQEFSPKGIHVYHVPDLYFKEKDVMKEYMSKHGLPLDAHAGTDDTSELEYVDKMVNGPSPKWIRPDKLVNGHDGDGTGVNGDQTKATLELGKTFTDAKVSLAVNQIKQLIAAAK